MGTVTIRVDAGPDQRFASDAFDGVVGTDTKTDWILGTDGIEPSQASTARILEATVSDDGTHALMTLETAPR